MVLSIDVADFTRRVEHPARSAGLKKRRTGIGSVLGESESASAVPMNTTGFVLAPATAIAEIFRRMNDVCTALGRIEREVGRLATEVAHSRRLVDGQGENDN